MRCIEKGWYNVDSTTEKTLIYIVQTNGAHSVTFNLFSKAFILRGSPRKCAPASLPSHWAIATLYVIVPKMLCSWANFPEVFTSSDLEISSWMMTKIGYFFGISHGKHCFWHNGRENTPAFSEDAGKSPVLQTTSSSRTQHLFLSLWMRSLNRLNPEEGPSLYQSTLWSGTGFSHHLLWF